MATLSNSEMLQSPSTANGKFLCLTICGYRKPGMSEEDYRNHMVNVSAPMTKDLMVKYGVKRWTQIHNQSATRALMYQLFDAQMCNLADFDCFSQVVFKSVEDYKRMKDDPWYKQHLMGDHLKFADTKKSMMTIGWVEEFVRDGKVVDGFKDSDIRESWKSSLGKLVFGLTITFGLIQLLDFYGYSILHKR